MRIGTALSDLSFRNAEAKKALFARHALGGLRALAEFGHAQTHETLLVFRAITVRSALAECVIDAKTVQALLVRFAFGVFAALTK